MPGDRLKQLIADILKQQNKGIATLPPVEKWNPTLSGEMDLTICRDGSWVHEGEPITRKALIKLFSSILKKEGDSIYLVTPAEKWRIRVEDAPFFVTEVDRIERGGVQALVFTTSTEDTIIAGPDNPLRIEVNAITGEPSPYIHVRQGMEGLLNRNVFYQLAEWAEQSPDKKKAARGVYSLGEFYPLE